MTGYRRKGLGFLFLALIFICNPSPATCGRIAPGLLDQLDKGEPGRRYPVIVKMVEQADSPLESAEQEEELRAVRVTKLADKLRRKADNAQLALRTYLEGKTQEGKVTAVQPFWIFNGLAMSAPPEIIRELAERSDVAEVESDRVIGMAVPVLAAPVSGSWNLGRINVGVVWERGFAGQGAVVATLDSGVDINHPDLLTQWRGGVDGWFDPYDGTATPFDENGHGTGVMGIIVGGGASGVPLGVAPQAQWIAAKVFHNVLSPVTGRLESVAEVSKIHAGFQWLLGLGANAPDVVNNSWDLDSPGTFDAEFRNDIQQLKNAGIQVVFAAGNAGPNPNTSVSPANYPEAVSAGASDQLDHVALFSSRGPSAFDGVSTYPTLVAPGDSIQTWGLTNNGLLPSATQFLSGTSFAAPHVTGAIALLKSAVPGVTMQQIEDALKNSIVGLAPDNSSGYGRLDVGKAFSYLALPGDVNGDGRVTIGDAIIVLRAVVNLDNAVGLVMKNGDVAPLGLPDGRINVEDALLVLQKAIGVITF